MRHKPLQERPYACNGAFARALAQQNQLGASDRTLRSTQSTKDAKRKVAV